MGALLATLSVIALGCSRTPGGDGAPEPDLRLTLPLPTSLMTANALFAIVPMGRLSSVTGTFWQLVTRPHTSARWALATPPGVASNGGLVAEHEAGARKRLAPRPLRAGGPAGAGAPAPSGALVVGFLTSNLLGFSPLARTTDGGRSWSGAVLPRALTPVPGALAGSSSGGSIALLGRGGKTVSSSPSGLGGWRSITTRASLATSATGAVCKLQGLASTAFVQTRAGSGRSQAVPAVGAVCAHKGIVGIFEPQANHWRNIGPRLVAVTTTEVAGLSASGTTLHALVAARDGSQWKLVELTAGGQAARWTASGELVISRGTRVQALGWTAAAPWVLLAEGPAASPRAERLEVLDAGNWRLIARPPRRTQTVAYGPLEGPPAPSGYRLQALAVSGSVLTIYELDSSGAWVRSQLVRVKLENGSAR
ncbi:MAG: hypothetical protein ACYCSF_04340 [Acidimicrobiales bacterium]